MIPNQRDRDLIQQLGKTKAELDELRTTTVGRWGRVPTTAPTGTPPDGSIWIDPTLPAIIGRANGATFTTARSERTGVILSTTQTIANATFTDISWLSEQSDVDGWHTGTSAALYVPVGHAGRYTMLFRGRWVGDPVDARASLHINGDHFGSIAHLAWYDFQHLLNIACVTLAEDDELLFSVYHSAGANRDISCTLEIAWLEP